MTTEKLITEKGKSYWANNGAYSEMFDIIWHELIPSSGNAETVHGELVRCFGRLNYEFGNNGNCNLHDWVSETCPHCDGDGYESNYSFNDDEEEQETCSYCDGNGNVEEVFEIDDYYSSMLHFVDNYLTCDSVDNLREFLLNPRYHYGNYTFDEDQMSFYNAVGDAVGHYIENNPNKNL
jgi:hypothetical protein